jgi:hypothetical protein
MIKNKIVIGTANLDNRYGILKNEIKSIEFNKILKLALKNNIKFIETSERYLKAINALTVSKTKNFNIIYKITLQNRSLKEVTQSLKNLTNDPDYKKIYSIMFHSEKDFNNKNFKKVYDLLVKMKKQNFLKKIGYSVYRISFLDKLLKKYKLDAIQLPINIFNQSFIENNYLKKIKSKYKIEIHIRSIFLQGVLTSKTIPQNLMQFDKNFLFWKIFLKKNKLNNVYACTNFIKTIPPINKIVIGFNSVSQFKLVLKNFFKKTNYDIDYSSLSIKNEKLINPVNWKE